MKLAIICGTIAFVALMGTILRSCQDARDQYYVAMNKCTEMKGTWVPKGDGSTYTGMCIYPH